MTISACPLAWPEGWPRTSKFDQKFGRFGQKDQSGRWPSMKDLTIPQARRRIYEELEKMDGPGREWTHIDPDTIVISTNMRVRKSDGGIAADQRKPDDPGVALYFTRDGKPQCIPCDSYTEVAQNLAAVAATLSALRALERHGSGLMDRAFTGFTALPDNSQPRWFVVLDVNEFAPYCDVKMAYQRKRSHCHPDKGGDAAMFDRVEKAWAQFREERGQ